MSVFSFSFSFSFSFFFVFLTDVLSAGHDLNNTKGAYAWVTFAYSAKTGPYVTTYLYSLDC